MDITGHSTDFIVDLSLPAAMRRFALRSQLRWPGLFLDGEAAGPAPALESWNLPENSPDDTVPGLVSFSSGQDMEDFWEENGYALDEAGEGPYSVFYRMRSQPLRADEVSGVRCPDPEAAQAVEGTMLLLAQYYGVSLVTPEDPATDAFSAAVLKDFLDSFAGA
ncbi:hypothetical protein [Streptomyces sp. NPDC059009]|uniref:hypothetical protein n=1 Tax=Streptomyces sp. NPDC059009 TaxID=3346694 RepID=UPI0036BBE0EA